MKVVRHLHRHGATLGDVVKQSGKETGVAAQPVQHRIAEDEIKAAVRLPAFQIGLNPSPIGMASAGLFQHAGRTIKAGDFRLRPPGMQLLRAVARSAAQVNDPLGIFKFDPGNQVSRGACALIREFQVEIGIPVGHLSSD
jgi:hypothetical protein